MAVNQDRIESFLEYEDLLFYRSGDETECTSWFLMFGNKTGINVRLLEDGECVLFRSQPLVHMDEHDRAGCCRVWEAMAHRNDQMMVGRFSGTEDVVVEAALPIEDGEVSDKQLKRVLGVIIHESSEFGPHLRRIAHDPSADIREDPIDGLMRKLIDGDEEVPPATHDEDDLPFNHDSTGDSDNC